MKNLLLAPVLVALACATCARHGGGAARAGIQPPASNTSPGRLLFLKNCAHCHGADAHGDEGPDLHRLDWTGDQIAQRIRNGKQGQMTAFSGKLSDSEIDSLVKYVRALE